MRLTNSNPIFIIALAHSRGKHKYCQNITAMRNLLMLSIFLGLSVHLFAQSYDPIESFYQKYKAIEDANHLKVSGLLLNLAIPFVKEKEARQLLPKVRRLRILTIPGSASVATADLLSLRQSVLGNNFDELISVRDGGDLFQVYLQEDKDGLVRQLFVVVEATDALTLINLRCKLHYSDIPNFDFSSGERVAVP